MEKQIKQSQSYVTTMLGQPQLIQNIQTTQVTRNSFDDQTQSQKLKKLAVFQPDNSEIANLPKDLKVIRDKLMNRGISLKDRLIVSSSMLKDCKLIDKKMENEFKLGQKPELLNNVTTVQLKILSRFMFDVYQEHIEPYIDNNENENFTYPKIFGHLPQALQQECLPTFQYMVLTIFCKLMLESKTIFAAEEAKVNSKDAEYNSGQFKLASFLVIKMIYKQELKKDLVSFILNFADQNASDLLSRADKKKSNMPLDVTGLYPAQRNLIEELVTCYVVLCVSSLDQLDQDQTLQALCKLLIVCFRLSEKMPLLFQKLYNTQSQDFAFGFVFQENLLVDSHTSSYYSHSTLLNMLLVVTKTLIPKFNSRHKQNKMNEVLNKMQDMLDQDVIKSIDSIIIRQIRIYQLTEQFVKIKKVEMPAIESIKEVDEGSQSDEGDQVMPSEEKKVNPIINQQSIRAGQNPTFNSLKVILDPEILSSARLISQPVALQEDFDEQLNWMRVNINVMEIANQIIPNYFHRKENELPSDQRMSQPKSIISHFCDLARIQLSFIARFQHFQPLNRQFKHPLIEIPNVDSKCFLIETLMKLFAFTVYQGKNHDYKLVMLKQIYITLDMISEGHFDQVDQQYYLKLMFLLFMNNQLENIVEPIAIFGNEIQRAQSYVKSLINLIKSDFYSEKYLKLFEETFDNNNIQDIYQLQEIVRELEQKRGDDLTQNLNTPDEAVILINKVLIQIQAINQLVQTAYKSDIICTLALDQAFLEIQNNGMKNCDPQGAIYVERSQHITLANGQSQISILEYKLSQSGPFSSQLYIYLKLVLGLINEKTTQNGKAYDILNYSDQHFEKWHQNQNYAMSKNSFGIRGSSQQQIGFQPHQQQCGLYQCDDCLRLNYLGFELNSQLRPSQLISLFSVLLRKIQELSKSLEDQDQLQNNQLGQNQFKQMTSMSAEQIRSHLSKIKLGQNHNKVITKKTLMANQSSGFKIVEKVNGLLSRFMLYCSQNKQLVSNIIASITNVERENLPNFGSPLDKLQLKSMKLSNFLPVGLRENVNLEFKGILLRNLLFRIEYNPYETATYILELIKDNLKQLKIDHQKYKEYSNDFRKLMNLLDPFSKQRQSQESGYLRGSRERSASNIFFSDYDSHLQKQRMFYRRLAEVQITTLSLYTKIVKKDDYCLEIFERKNFLEQVLMHMQRYVVQEGSYISELIQEGLNMFLFQRREPTDPFNIKLQTSFYKNSLIQQSNANTLVTVYERMLEFVLTTIVDFIQVTYNEDSESTPPTTEQQVSVLQTIKIVLETLNNKIIVKEGRSIRESITADLLKLQRSIRVTEIQLLKKIFIFLREQQTIQIVDIQYIIKQMSTLLLRLFSGAPKPVHLREFFSFLREIFYHNQLMDEVDVSLADDVLTILNNAIKFRSKSHQLSFQNQKNEMIDHFVFGKTTPGVLLLNDFDVSKEIQWCVLFRIAHEQIAQEIGVQSKKQVKMVLLSIQQRQPVNGNNITIENIGFNLEVIVDLETSTFNFCDHSSDAPPQDRDKNQSNTNWFKPRPLENRWHLLIFKLKVKSGFLSGNENPNLEVYLDKLDQTSRVVYQLPRLDPRQQYLLSMGNSAEFCASTGLNKVQNLYFRGRMSLPLFFSGLPDSKSFEQNTDALRAIRESLTEFLNTKELIGKKQLDLNPWIQKFTQDIQRESFKPNKKYILNEFQTLDNYNQQIIALHQALYKQGFLCAAHCRRASEVFVGLGGFKNMYPLVQKVIKSNLSTIGVSKPALIISQIFKVLGSLLDQEPDHIENHLRKKNLIQLLRFSILRLGKHQMITQDLIIDIKNIVRKNILSQAIFTNQNQKYYLIQGSSAPIRNHKQFFSEFLREYTHQILLNIKIAILPCQVIPKSQIDNSSTTHSSISGGPRQTIVFTEFLDLIHHICAPKPLLSQEQNAKSSKFQLDPDQDKNQESASSQMESSAVTGRDNAISIFCDGEILQQNILNYQTVYLLLELTSNFEILNQLMYHQIYILSECLSASILYLDDYKSLTGILHKVCNENLAMSKIQLLIYLQVILQIIKSDELKVKSALFANYQDPKQFKIESIAAILFQFEQNPRDKMTEDIKILSDKIVSIVLLILIRDFFVRKSLNTSKKIQGEKVARNDPEKRQLIDIIQKYLYSNNQIYTETYLTLMQLALNKRKCADKSPMVDEIDTAIKETRLISQSKILSEVIEFDIDLYFIVLKCFDKLAQQTRLVFLNQVTSFVKNQGESFMKLLLGQQTSDDTNPFFKKLQEFYHQITNLCIEYKEDVIVQSCQKVLIEVCVNLLTHNLDETEELMLTQADEKSLYLFRRIILYFGDEHKYQLYILQSIIKRILVEINWRKNPYQQLEQTKLNLRMIQFLQFVEEFYITNTTEISEQPAFHQSLVILMLLFEQLGLLSMDVPDRITGYQDILNRQNQSNQVRQTQESNINPSSSGKGFQQQQKDDQQRQNNLPTQSFDRSQSQQITKQAQLPNNHENFQIISQLPQLQKRAENFVSGGPVRIFMHMLFSCLSNIKTSVDSFQLILDLLRFLTLREKSQFVISQIKFILGEDFDVSAVLIYNLFNKGNLVNVTQTQNKVTQISKQKQEESKSMRDNYLITRGYILSPEQTQIVKTSLLDQETEIQHKTLEGILQTTNKHLMDENLANSIIDQTKLTSFQDQQIAHASQTMIEKQKRWGFTLIDGFIFFQMIAEFMHVLNKILHDDYSGEKSSDTADFNAQIHNQRAFVDNDSQQLVFSSEIHDEGYMVVENFLSPQQIKLKLQSQSKLAKILPLCRLMFDCMNEQIQGGQKDLSTDIAGHLQQLQFYNSVEQRLIDRITRFLDDHRNKTCSETGQSLTSLSRFLENDQWLDEEYYKMDGTTESNYSFRVQSENRSRFESNSDQSNQQQAVVVLNTMGFVDINLLNQQVRNPQKKGQGAKIFTEQEFQSPVKEHDNLNQDQGDIKVQDGGIRLSTIQQTYFGESSSNLTRSQDFSTNSLVDLKLQSAKSQQPPEIAFDNQQVQNFNLPEQINVTEDTLKESLVENQSQQNEDERKSWVLSVMSNYIAQNKNNQVSQQNLIKFQDFKEEQQRMRDQFQTQVFDFIRQLYIALIQLINEQREDDKIELLERILSQTLFNEKQRKISLSFGAATSHRFTPELLLAKFKSNEINKLVQAEKEKIAFDLRHAKQDSDKRRNAQLLGPSILQNNSLMQSQHVSKGVNQFGDFSDQHQFTPQKRTEQLGNSSTAYSVGYQPGQLKGIQAQRQINLHSSQVLNLHPNTSIDISAENFVDDKCNLDDIYIKNLFKKTIKRLQEDESSIWFDKLEEQLIEFKEIKEIYEQMQFRLEPNQLTADIVWRNKKEGIDLKGKPPEMVKFLDQYLKNIENHILVQNPAGRNYFVAQRRNTDSWGRMMLLKPNRKALQYQAWKFYDYFVHDFLSKAFAVSLLNDEDFPDLIKPHQVAKQPFKEPKQSDTPRAPKKSKLEDEKDNPQIEAIDSDDSDFEGNEQRFDQESQDSHYSSFDQNNSSYQDYADQPVPFSQELQRVRLDILQRMERNKLLQRVLSGQQELKRKLEVNQDLVIKTRTKIENIVRFEEQNRISEKFKYSFDAQMIKVKGNIWGKVIVTEDYFAFISYCQILPDEVADQLKYVNTTKEQNLPIKQQLIFKWENIEEVMRRKVINVFQGIDLTTQEKKVYTFNLTTIANCESFLKNVKTLISKKGDEVTLRLIEDPVHYFKNVDQCQNEWKNGTRTNMEFLLLINKYSSRSFNDLSQYPIFPWVLNDYDCNVYEFDQQMKNELCFRNFQKHTGIMGDQKAEDIQQKFEEMEQIDRDTGLKQGPEAFEQITYGEESFQMRMGFSTQMNCSHYLSRIEPFTTAIYFNQDQDRDPRIPISFQHSWQNTIKQSQSCNELIPEHFYFPEALVNLNCAHLGFQPDGVGQNEYSIDQMIIPQWASSHFDFVRIQRECLESAYVTENLGYWIDLVFGCQQKSVEKLNKFFCLAYEEWHKQPESFKKISPIQMKAILDFYTVPSKLFDTTVVTKQEQIVTAAAQSMQIDTNEAKTNFNPNFPLIKAFLEYKTNNYLRPVMINGQLLKERLKLGQISVHNYLDSSTNIVHILFNNEKKCLVFVRQEDTKENNGDQGNLVVYVCQETLTKDFFKEKYVDLHMRYEWVADELHNVFQVYFTQDSKSSNQSSMKLFACGYSDNSLRIFDLDTKSAQIKIIRDHSARITCIKFSADYKYLYTCDEDGIILHYTRNKIVQKEQKESFPYTLLHKIQDQNDEILAIDTNQTLDMYTTLSRDGTIAVRCQRTSKLWVYFKMFSKRTNTRKEDVIITGFSKAFSRIDAIRLSLHGYIVLVGTSAGSKSNQSKYLVYNLNGDTLLASMEEKCTIKSVFLNSTEDLMILAQNCQLSQDQSQQGNIRVLKLFGLEKIANLTKICYEEPLKEIKSGKNQNKDVLGGIQKGQPIKTPMIGAIALKKREASLNIFYIDPIKNTKEILCFESSKSTVWRQLEDMALAPRQRQDIE